MMHVLIWPGPGQVAEPARRTSSQPHMYNMPFQGEVLPNFSMSPHNMSYPANNVCRYKDAPATMPKFSIKVTKGRAAELQAKAQQKKTLHLYPVGMPPMWKNLPGDKQNRASVVGACLR